MGSAWTEACGWWSGKSATRTLAVDGSAAVDGDGANPEGSAAGLGVRSATAPQVQSRRNGAMPAPAYPCVSPAAPSPESCLSIAARGRAGGPIEKCSDRGSEPPATTNTP